MTSDAAILRNAANDLAGIEGRITPLVHRYQDGYEVAQARSLIQQAQGYLRRAADNGPTASLDEMNRQFDAELDAYEAAGIDGYEQTLERTET